MILRLGNLTTQKTFYGMLNIGCLTSHSHYISSVIYFWDARKVHKQNGFYVFFKNILLTVLFVIEHSYHEYIFYLYEALKKNVSLNVFGLNYLKTAVLI